MSDLISRQQAIDMIEKHLKWTTIPDYYPGIFEAVRGWLNGLPPVQPERKTGRWIPDNTDYYRTKFICSACGESEEVPTTGFGYGTMWDYCPMCGAKMEAGE